nr:hypothetical protein [Tanacetum cinerariifolium]
EDIGNAHIPKVNLRQDWWKPLEEERPATPEPVWSIPSSDVPVLKNNQASALASTYSPPPEDSLLAQTGPAFELVKVFHPDVIHLQYQMEECHKLLIDSMDDPILRHNVSKPLPLDGPPGQTCTVHLEDEGGIHHDAWLEEMVPDQFWIDEECKYDIAVMYGISHWWFQRQRFYIDLHTSEGDRRAVRIRIWILSVVRIEVFSIYGYDYMKKIVLHRVDLNEHVIAERDFKYLYLSDFEDPYMLNLQGHLNHLLSKDKKILTTAVNQWTRHLVIRQRVEDFHLGIESYQTQLNLTKPQWDATGFEYKHDYTVIGFPRAVMFWDKYRVRIMMCFNEIHKFSDGTLQQIDEALDYRVKEFRINMMNPECHKLLTDSVDDSILRHNVSKPLPLGGPPGQMWIEEEYKYDIVAIYGISHWWFQRQRFYIDKHTSKGNHRAVRTHMRILSVVRIKVFSMYGYDYMKKIVLHRADLNEHVIAERDFKYLYPSVFEDLYLLNLQGFEYKHGYIVIDSPRAVTFRDRYGVQMVMRFNKIHKFSDGTLQQIDEALDYRVKEFKINMVNLGLNTRFWTRKDVDRSKEFMFAI